VLRFPPLHQAEKRYLTVRRKQKLNLKFSSFKVQTKMKKKSLKKINDSEAKLNPIPIIVGVPRSGTTLLRFMLDSHPEMAIPPETGFIPLLNSLNESNNDDLRKEFFQLLTNFSSWQDFEIDKEIFWGKLSQCNPFNISDGCRIFYKLYSACFNKLRYGDKTPTYCLNMLEIQKLIPEARFIHLIRDGRDVALSLRKMWFSPGNEIEVQANYWSRLISTTREQSKQCNYYLEIYYEDLILNTEKNLKEICHFIELSYHSEMLNYYYHTPTRLKEHKGRILNDGQVLTQEQRLKQQQKTTEIPDQKNLFKWKEQMSREEIKLYEEKAGPLLKDLGYELNYPEFGILKNKQFNNLFSFFKRKYLQYLGHNYCSLGCKSRKLMTIGLKIILT